MCYFSVKFFFLANLYYFVFLKATKIRQIVKCQFKGEFLTENINNKK